ncbi:sugar ABC transporter substrate-binding protein [Acrocarpospora catenulata]|uniref:sugar ABC transporter substrate-binding protein n=1 Tax=Acrocarpospora catenulata TaxID=2836182 RepID=UPI001BDA505B|nr:substrate-binding domain-containing protein [Acrocarpospora catenulata]
MMLRNRTAATAVTLALALGVAACGGQSSGSPSSSPVGSAGGLGWKGTGDLKGSGEIALFMPGAGLPFNTNFRNAVTELFKSYGYTVKAFENAYDQSEQDRQVQQYLATGAKPAGVLFYPPAPEAAKNSARQLARLAPVAWSVTAPAPTGYPFGGNSHAHSGEIEAQVYVDLLAKLKAEGTTLPNDGAILVYNAPVELAPGKIRLDAFKQTLDAKGVKYTIVGEENGMVDRESGYKLASGSLAKYAGKFDIVWALNLGGAEGVAQALKEAGRTPGKDVWVIAGGDCTPGLAGIASGDVYSTITEAGGFEGTVGARTLLQLIANGDVKSGTLQYPEAAAVPELPNEAPSENTFAPLAAVTKDNMDTLQMWGVGAKDICK